MEPDQILAVVMPMIRVVVAPYIPDSGTGPRWLDWQRVMRDRLAEVGIDYKEFSTEDWPEVMRAVPSGLPQRFNQGE